MMKKIITTISGTVFAAVPAPAPQQNYYYYDDDRYDRDFDDIYDDYDDMFDYDD